jgi:hypothetical protein
VKAIPLTRDGFVAFVSDEDYERVSQYTWHLFVARRKDGSARQFYAYRNLASGVKGGTHRIQYMQHLVFGEAARLDHKDQDGLNNQKVNIRRCTRAQNAANQRLRLDNKSGFKGVYLTKGKRWMAQIRVSGKSRFLGQFGTPEEAATAYDEAARLYFGEFAAPNFPEVAA